MMFLAEIQSHRSFDESDVIGYVHVEIGYRMINNSFRLRVDFHQKCVILDDVNKRKIADAILTSPT